MERIVERPGVHKASVTAQERIAEFATIVHGLLALRDWLEALGVRQVAMEVTGVYWKPVWAVLEDRCELMLGNARHVKQVPGRKTERRDQATLRRLSRRGRPDARVGLIHVAPTSAQRRQQPALRGSSDGGQPTSNGRILRQAVAALTPLPR